MYTEVGDYVSMPIVHYVNENSSRIDSTILSLQWRHNERDGIWNHQPHDCLLNRLFEAQFKENTKAPRHWPLRGEFTGEFPAQRVSNAGNVSIWWRHHTKSLS